MSVLKSIPKTKVHIQSCKCGFENGWKPDRPTRDTHYNMPGAERERRFASNSFLQQLVHSSLLFFQKYPFDSPWFSIPVTSAILYMSLTLSSLSNIFLAPVGLLWPVIRQVSSSDSSGRWGSCLLPFLAPSIEIYLSFLYGIEIILY